MKKHYTKHGQCNTKLYQVWEGIISRVNGKCKPEIYFNRCISICNEWRTPMNFINWARQNGYREGLVIDRINNNDNYEPGNCRFVTYHESNLNIRRRPDFGIYWRKDRNTYQIRFHRYGRNTNGGSTKDIFKARTMRDNLLKQLKMEENEH